MSTIQKPTDIYSVEDVGNQHGYLCPACCKGDNLTIRATVTVNARLYPDGTDDNGGDTEWDDESLAWCGCGWSGTVEDFAVVEVED